jgi:hypothetical protein
VQVGGFVAGVVEDGGTCTLTLTKGGETVVGTSEARGDASTTTCGAVIVSGDKVSAGGWQGVLSYRSAERSGTAPAVSIEVAR